MVIYCVLFIDSVMWNWAPNRMFPKLEYFPMPLFCCGHPCFKNPFASCAIVVFDIANCYLCGDGKRLLRIGVLLFLKNNKKYRQTQSANNWDGKWISNTTHIGWVLGGYSRFLTHVVIAHHLAKYFSCLSVVCLGPW